MQSPFQPTRQYPFVSVGKFPVVEQGPQFLHGFPEFRAVVLQENRISGFENVFSDMESEEFVVEELEIQRMAKEVLSHQNFDEGDADADIAEDKLGEQLSFEDKTVKSGVGFPFVGIHRRQFGNAAVMSRQASAVDDEGIMSCANELGNRFVEMRLHRNIQIGINQVVSLRIFVQPLQEVDKDRKGWERRVIPYFADAAVEVRSGTEVCRNGRAILWKLRCEQFDGDISEGCGARAAHGFQGDRLHPFEFRARRRHKDIDQMREAQWGRLAGAPGGLCGWNLHQGNALGRLDRENA